MSEEEKTWGNEEKGGREWAWDDCNHTKAWGTGIVRLGAEVLATGSIGLIVPLLSSGVKMRVNFSLSMHNPDSIKLLLDLSIRRTCVMTVDVDRVTGRGEDASCRFFFSFRALNVALFIFCYF